MATATRRKSKPDSASGSTAGAEPGRTPGAAPSAQAKPAAAPTSQDKRKTASTTARAATLAGGDNAATPDTRTRILTAAQRLFRKRGYHATGLNDILELAQAPKGSMYHHFPGGKEEIGVCVIDNLTRGLIGLFEQSRARSAQAMVRDAGEQLVVVAEKTGFEVCALYSSFVAERKTSPLLGAAVAEGYGQMLTTLQARMVQDGMAAKLAAERAQLVVAMLEGGSLLAQARQDAGLFRTAVKQAALLCSVEGEAAG